MDTTEPDLSRTVPDSRSARRTIHRRVARVVLAVGGLTAGATACDRAAIEVSDSYRMSIARSSVDAIRPRGSSVQRSYESAPVTYWDQTDEMGHVYRELRMPRPSSAAATARLFDGALDGWRVVATDCDADRSITILAARVRRGLPLDLRVHINPDGATAALDAELPPAFSGFDVDHRPAQRQRCWAVEQRQARELARISIPALGEPRELHRNARVPSSFDYGVADSVTRRYRVEAPHDAVVVAVETALFEQGWVVAARNCNGRDPNRSDATYIIGDRIEETELHHDGFDDVVLVTYWQGNYTDLSAGRTVDIKMHDPRVGPMLTTGGTPDRCPETEQR